MKKVVPLESLSFPKKTSLDSTENLTITNQVSEDISLQLEFDKDSSSEKEFDKE